MFIGRHSVQNLVPPICCRANGSGVEHRSKNDRILRKFVRHEVRDAQAGPGSDPGLCRGHGKLGTRHLSGAVSPLSTRFTYKNYHKG